MLHIVIARTRHPVHTHATELTALATGLHARSIVVQLHIANLVATAVEHPCGTIVIKKQRRIMVEREFHFGPRAIFHIGGLVKVRLVRGIRRRQDIEKTIAVANARCPRALAISIIAVQVHLVVVGKRLVDIPHGTPLSQIRTLENRHARCKMHRGRHHVIRIVNADNRGVRTIDIHNRVIDRCGRNSPNRNQSSVGHTLEEPKTSHIRLLFNLKLP